MTIKKNRIGVGGFPHNKVLIFNVIFVVLLMVQQYHFVMKKLILHNDKIFFNAYQTQITFGKRYCFKSLLLAQRDNVLFQILGEQVLH